MARLRVLFLCILLLPCLRTVKAQQGDARNRVESPDGQIAMIVSAGRDASASLQYSVQFHGKQLLAPSALGLQIAGQAPLGPGMHAVHVESGQHDETYTVPAGKTRDVRDHYNVQRIDFEDAAGRRLSVEVRAYDDALAFRYIIPEQPAFTQVRIEHELTEFCYSKDATLYPLLLEGFQTPYEDEYQMRQVNGIHKDWLIGLPLLAEVPGVGWVGITEAYIHDYAGMYLRKAAAPYALRAELSPRLDQPGVAVVTAAPFTSPWRVLLIGDAPGRLVESNVILNLNPPSKIADTSWIKPGKAAWDWWSGDAAPGAPFTPGMNTATMKHYIDFASGSGFAYMLIDAGWAVAAKDVPGNLKDQDDITRVQPEIDMPELLRYAAQKHARLWLWADWLSVDKYMDQAFPMFEKWGVAGVKIDFMQRDDQQMVAWYQHVLELAAQHHLMIDFHGAFKPDGLRRTWPNLITREGVMGKEYLKWSARTTPVHNTTLPFTRMLAGPLDYTPGAFGNSTRADFVARMVEPMGLDTRAHELALYVVLESPFQMVSDYPERYQGQHDFEFIRQVPTTWDEIRVLTGRPMENISVARRSGRDWFVGSITNWDARTVRLPLKFLEEGKYTAEIYADAPDADVNATHTTFTRQAVDRNTQLTVQMAPGGGNAIWIHPE